MEVYFISFLLGGGGRGSDIIQLGRGRFQCIVIGGRLVDVLFRRKVIGIELAWGGGGGKYFNLDERRVRPILI